MAPMSDRPVGHTCTWPSGCRPGDRWTCPDCQRPWLAERWDTDADDYVVLVWLPLGGAPGGQ